jgi:4-hydroxy-3-methylbut-2-enyl diphosphate reductase
MKIIKADHLGMCFGVRDAIALAKNEAAAAPITILGELAHNETVIADLRARGVQIQPDPSRVNTRRVMITAHGASNRSREALLDRGFQVMEATCPLVHFAHRALARLVAAGFFPVVVGKRDHVEVRGLTGDFDAFEVILCDEDVRAMKPRAKLGIVAQTTQPIDRVRSLVNSVRREFPHSEINDTVCHPTKSRQESAVEISRQSDVVVVIGGANSNNTRELVSTCLKHCPRVHHIQGAAELQRHWFDAAETVGLTAGTSTPDTLIQQVEQWLANFARSKNNFVDHQFHERSL